MQPQSTTFKRSAFKYQFRIGLEAAKVLLNVMKMKHCKNTFKKLINSDFETF